YLAGACRNLESPSLIVGGGADHVHILCRLSKNLAPAILVRELKRESSKWVKKEASGLLSFSWQQGDGPFSLSPYPVEPRKLYTADRDNHDRRVTFQDEFRRLLRKYGVEYDERYVWD